MARILVIDDEEDLRFTLGKFLLNEGHEVVRAAIRRLWRLYQGPISI